jgi:hypothetical protein
MSLKERLLGRRLASWQAEHVTIGVWRGVPALGLDGLGSASYGPEAALPSSSLSASPGKRRR